MPTDDQGNWIPNVHKNRIYSIPEIGDGPRNTFSRTDFLEGRSPVNYGSGQHADVFGAVQPSDDPRLWPKLWPRAGTLLNVPKVVILSDYIAWPEFWKECCFDFPRQVIGTGPGGIIGNYYQLHQWNQGIPWRGPSNSAATSADYRFARTVADHFQNPSYQEHQRAWYVYREAKRILEEHPTDPIYVVLPNWIPFEAQQKATRNTWDTWSNDDRYNPPGDECNPSVLDGVVQCDIYTNGSDRGRVYPDVNGPNMRSDALSPPRVPCLLSQTPYFGCDVLHIWQGHWCQSWNSPSFSVYESWPLSPAGTQIGPITLTNYLGNDFFSAFDGLRQAWSAFVAGAYGYGDSGDEFISGRLGYYGGAIDGAAASYKENFWKYRNFGVRLFPWRQEWAIAWRPDEIIKDQKWCPSQQFYFGLSFEEFARQKAGEDSYAVDYSHKYGGLRFANTWGRFPDSPSIREAVEVFFPPLRVAVDTYYTGLNKGTLRFYELMMERTGLEEFNVKVEGRGIPASVPAIDTVDGLVEYVRTYFAEQEELRRKNESLSM